MSWNATYRAHLAQIPYPDIVASTKDVCAFGIIIWGLNEISFSTSFVRKRANGHLGIWFRVSIFDIKNRLIVGNEISSRIARAPSLNEDGAYQNLSSPIPYAFVCNVPPDHGILLQLCGVLYTGETCIMESHPSNFVSELSTNIVIQDEVVLGWALFQYEDREVRKIESVLEHARNSSVTEVQLIRGNPADLFNDTYEISEILSQKSKSSKRAPFLRRILFKYKQRNLAIRGTSRYVIPFFSLIDAMNCPPIFIQRETIKFQDKLQQIEIPGTLLDAPERTQLISFSITSIAASVARFYDFNYESDVKPTKPGSGALRMVHRKPFEQHIKECVAQLLVPKLADRTGHDISEEHVRIHILGYNVKVLSHDGFQPMEASPCEIPLYWINDEAYKSSKYTKKIREPSGDCRRLMESEQGILFEISSKQVSVEAMEYTDLRYDMSSGHYGEVTHHKYKHSRKNSGQQSLAVQFHAGLIIALCVTISITLNSLTNKDFFLPRCEFCLGWGYIDILPNIFSSRSQIIPCTLRLTTEDEFTAGVPGINTPILNCNKITKCNIWAANTDLNSVADQSHHIDSKFTSTEVPKKERPWSRMRSSSQGNHEFKRKSTRSAKRFSNKYSDTEMSHTSYTATSDMSYSDSESDCLRSTSNSLSSDEYVYEYIYPVISISLCLTDDDSKKSSSINRLVDGELCIPQNNISQKADNTFHASLHNEKDDDSIKSTVTLNVISPLSISHDGSDSDYITHTPTVKHKRSHQVSSNTSTEKHLSPPQAVSTSEKFEGHIRSSSAYSKEDRENSVPQYLPPIESDVGPFASNINKRSQASQIAKFPEEPVTANLEQTLTNIKAYEPDTYKKYKNFSELKVLAISPLQVHLHGVGFLHALYHGSSGEVQEVYGSNINLSDLVCPKNISPYYLSTSTPMASQLIGCTISLCLLTNDSNLNLDQSKSRAHAIASCYILFLKTNRSIKSLKRAYYDLYGYVTLNEQEFNDHIIQYQENLSFQADLRSVYADNLFDLAREPIFTLELSVKLKTLEQVCPVTRNSGLNLRWETYKNMKDRSMRDTTLTRTALDNNGGRKRTHISVDSNSLNLLGTQRDIPSMQFAFPTKKLVTKTELNEVLDDYLSYIQKENKSFYTGERLTQMSMRASQILQQNLIIYPHYSGSVCLFPGLEAYERKCHPDDRFIISLLSPLHSQLEDFSIQVDYRMDDLHFLDTTSQEHIKDRPHWKKLAEHEIYLQGTDLRRLTCVHSPYAIISSSNTEIFARSAQIQLIFLLEYVRKGSKRQGTPLTSVINLSCCPYMPLTTNIRVCLPHSMPSELNDMTLNVVLGINTITREVFVVSPNYNGCYISQEDLTYLKTLSKDIKAESYMNTAIDESKVCAEDGYAGGSYIADNGSVLTCRTFKLAQSDSKSSTFCEELMGPSIHTPKFRVAIIPGAFRTFCSLSHIVKAGLGKEGVVYLSCNLSKEQVSLYFEEGNNYHIIELWKDQTVILRFGVIWSIFKHTYSEINAGISIQAPIKLISSNSLLVNTIPNIYNGLFSIPGPGIYILSLFPVVSISTAESFTHKGISCVVKVGEVLEIAHRYKITINKIENKRFKYQYQTSKVPNVQMEKPSITRFLGLVPGPASEPNSGIVKFRCGRWIWHRPYETVARVLVYSAEDSQAPYVVLFYLRFE